MRRAVLLLVLGALPACPAPAPAPAPSSSLSPDAGSTSPVLELTDDGRTLDVTQGTTITFRLARHAGTGFEWVPAPSDAGVVVQRGERRSVRTSDIPGAPKLDVYEMVASAPGTTTVEMQLRRPWEDRPPVKTMRVTIVVR